MIVPQRLFKYVTPERVDVLERNLIRYTQASALNDPFEGRVLARGLASREYILAEATEDFMDDQLGEALNQVPPPLRALLNDHMLSAVKREALRELPRAFDSLSPAIASIVTDAVSSKMRSLLGVLSLTEDPANALMWSHYAANGHGFVIGLDTSHLHFNAKKTAEDEFRHLRPVEYRDSRVGGYLVDFTGVEFFYVKPRVWEYEREWRIVRPLDDAREIRGAEDAAIYLYPLHENAISHVIFGYGMSETDSRQLEAILSKPDYGHVKASRATLSPSEFDVEVNL